MNAITLAVTDGKITTTSQQVAEHFGKRHDNVLRAIANLDCSPEFNRLNFEEASNVISQPNGGTTTYRNYNITKDGFMYLAMGFTGKEAAAWKEKYIAAFNAMDAQLRGPAQIDASEPPKAPKSLAAPDKLTRNLRSRINRKTHEIALEQYDTIHAFITHWASGNLACGATEQQCEGYIETAGRMADGTVLANINDLRELVFTVGQMIDMAGTTIAAIKRVEQRSGFDLYPRIEKSKGVSPDFHQHDRLVQETIDRMVGDPA